MTHPAPFCSAAPPPECSSLRRPSPFPSSALKLNIKKGLMDPAAKTLNSGMFLLLLLLLLHCDDTRCSTLGGNQLSKPRLLIMEERERRHPHTKIHNDGDAVGEPHINLHTHTHKERELTHRSGSNLLVSCTWSHNSRPLGRPWYS